MWRTIKYENVYLRASANVPETRASIGRYIDTFYNTRMPHLSLDQLTPDEAYFTALQPIPGCSITMAEIHLTAPNRLFKRASSLPRTSSAGANPHTRMFAMRYYPALDGLRAVSVLLVFLVHENLQTFPGGFIGVDIFFVISGFLITTILLDEHNVFGKISFKKFFIRRFIRLWPALYTMLLILLAGFLAIGAAGKYEAAFEWSSLYMMNWYRAFSLGDGYFLTHLWSLSVEEQFYLLWPLVIIILIRLPVNVAISFLILFMIVVTTWRIALVAGPANRLYHGLDTRIDTILAGTLLGVYLQTYSHTNLIKLGKYYFLPIIVLFAMVFYARWDSKFMDTIGFDIIYVCAVWVVYVCCFIDDSILYRVMCLPLLVHIGKRSYGFYLWHLPILYIIKKKTDPILSISKEKLPLKAIIFISGLVLSYCACAASYSFLEKKILSLKKKYQPFETDEPLMGLLK